MKVEFIWGTDGELRKPCGHVSHGMNPERCDFSREVSGVFQASQEKHSTSLGHPQSRGRPDLGGTLRMARGHQDLSAPAQGFRSSGAGGRLG